MKKYVIGVNEKDPEFRKHVAERVRLARNPRNQISWEELEKRIDEKWKARQEIRKNAKQI
jgi:hypothetical protein